VKIASFFVVVLLLVFSGTAFAAACVPGSMIVGPATLSGGAILTSTFSCTEGAYTFSNFEVIGDTVPVPVTNFSVSTGPATNASAYSLGFGYTDLDTNGDDFLLLFTITPGVAAATVSAGPGVSVSEVICMVATTPGTCPAPASNTLATLVPAEGGSAASSVTLAAEDWVVKDITGGSNVVETFTPEPVTSALMGLGLIAIGFVGRKRLRKD
jgi:hypothetical protein